MLCAESYLKNHANDEIEYHPSTSGYKLLCDSAMMNASIYTAITYCSVLSILGYSSNGVNILSEDDNLLNYNNKSSDIMQIILMEGLDYKSFNMHVRHQMVYNDGSHLL